jgi:hypothetical protein
VLVGDPGVEGTPGVTVDGDRVLGVCVLGVALVGEPGDAGLVTELGVLFPGALLGCPGVAGAVVDGDGNAGEVVDGWPGDVVGDCPGDGVGELGGSCDVDCPGIGEGTVGSTGGEVVTGRHGANEFVDGCCAPAGGVVD